MVAEMNRQLAAGEQVLLNGLASPERPVLFIIGVPRSGTTLLAQLLIGRYRLGYVNNLIAKFWEAPVIGTCLSLSLPGNRNETRFQLSSEFGFTEACDGHHEFGYFWRRFFPFDQHHQLEKSVLDEVDVALLRREIAGMEAAWNAPMLFKNAAALPLQTAFLGRALPTAAFLYIRRDPEAVAASLLKSRRQYSGAAERWFSIKPKGYEALRPLSVYEQIAGQIHYTQNGIEQQLAEVPPTRQLPIRYRDLCLDPAAFFQQFEDWLKRLGAIPQVLLPAIPGLKVAEAAFQDSEEQQAMLEALKKWNLCD